MSLTKAQAPTSSDSVVKKTNEALSGDTLEDSMPTGSRYLRASGSGMARLQISGHYAYPAVRSDLTPAPHFCQLARCIECHADSLSCPLTQLYIPGVPGGVQRGSRGSRGFATSRKHEK